MTSDTPSQTSVLARAADIFRALHDYLLSGMRRRPEPVNDPSSLRYFIETRASYIAQTSLYGYLRTRAGLRYPELFTDDVFVVSINIAKWHMWLACLSDLSVYAGGLLQRHASGTSARVDDLMRETVRAILDDTGVPAEADGEFPAHAQRVLDRLAQCDWEGVGDDDTPFTDSPAALVRWAPIVDKVKQLDEEIVRNSVRFHWQEVRRDLRSNLDAAAVLGAAGETEAS